MTRRTLPGSVGVSRLPGSLDRGRIINAVVDTTGRRARDLPIALDKVVG